jgi:hypothetical protein
MSINFTDEELANISLNYVQYPDQLAALVQGKAKVVESLDAIQKQDNENKKWTEFYQGVVLSYHEELKFKTSDDKTEYAGESLIDGAARREEVHFPATPPNVWINLPPKKIDSNTGLPVDIYTGLIEPNAISGVSSAKQVITTGYSDGSASTQLLSTYTIGGTSVYVDDIGGFSVGNRILVISGSVGMFAEITLITPDPGFCQLASGSNQAECEGNGGTWVIPSSGTFDINVLSPPSSNLGVGSSVRNYASGFTNGEREGTTSITPNRQAVLNIFKGLLDDAVQSWENQITNDQLPIVSTNEDQKRKTEVQDEVTDISTKKTGIDDWQSFPSEKQFVPSVVESRFGDIKLGDLETLYNDRSTKVTARVTQINTALDDLSQDPNNGSFSGSGVYYDYYDWFNKRVNAATGSLSQYYGTQIALEVADQNIDNLNSSKDETETMFIITKLSADATGTNFIEVVDATGFVPTDTIKIMANDQVIITTTIVNVVGTTIEVATSVSSDYSIGNVGRILKEL